jgi:hypothetical protein
VIARNSTLNNILQQIQTSIVKLEAKSSYSKMIHKIIDLVQVFTSMMRIAKKTVSSSDKNRQTREFIVIIIDVIEKKNLEIMFTKNIMSKFQNNAKSIRDMTRLVNDVIKRQAELTKTRKTLQKKLEIIKRLSNSITIKYRTYHFRVNDVKMNNINTIN